MTKPNFDHVDKFFEYNIDVPSKTLYIGSHSSEEGAESGTDHTMAEYAIKGLHVLDKSAWGDKPIRIIINNPGGDEYHGYAIYDAIRACESEVHIYVYGHAMSMGSIILQAGDKRYMSPRSKMMIHYGSWSFDGHSLDFLRSAEECKKQCEQMEDIFLPKMQEQNPKMTRAKFKTMFSFDKYLNAQECIDLGLVDEIIGE